MRFWTPIDLTSARRPYLLPNEVVILVQDGVGLYEGRYKVDAFQNGRLYLTTHRACYVDNSKPVNHSVAVDLARVTRIQFSPGLLRSSPKISLFLVPQALRLSTLSAAENGSQTLPAPSPVSATTASGAPDANANASWICPICSFSNAIKFADLDKTPPPCLTCGISPAAAVLAAAKIDFMERQQQRGSTPPVQRAGEVEIDTGFPCPRCTFVNHPSLVQCEICGADLVSRNLPPALANHGTLKEDITAFSRSPTPGVGSDEEITFVKISFRTGGEKTFLEKLKVVIRERAWEQHHRHHPHLASHLPDAEDDDTHHHHLDNDGAHETHVQHHHIPRLGIHGLETMNAKQRHHTSELMDSLSDLNTLMSKAQEMVALAESLARRLSSAPGVSPEARKALLESSTALSLSSPVVVREMAGSQDETFYDELARQVAEFLDNGVLVREGGIVTLVDLYALYNRARGISLISPKDFYKACSGFERLKLPFRMRKFRSGVIVVQEAYYTESKVKRMLLEWMRQMGEEHTAQIGVTTQDVNQRFGWSVMVAQEELEAAERSGQLCRDASAEGTRFYINLISSFKMPVVF
ncbi:putative vacuolar protein sorting protein [Myxozyma melibiosi]|uniref:Vacuolar protein-sorting-associated protein 36 n=1 Tax=Myxozyma melibiosi TaxID=54550 RepID=A0ABR1F9X5_9ASCO